MQLIFSFMWESHLYHESVAAAGELDWVSIRTIHRDSYYREASAKCLWALLNSNSMPRALRKVCSQQNTHSYQDRSSMKCSLFFHSSRKEEMETQLPVTQLPLHSHRESCSFKPCFWCNSSTQFSALEIHDSQKKWSGPSNNSISFSYSGWDSD